MAVSDFILIARSGSHSLSPGVGTSVCRAGVGVTGCCIHWARRLVADHKAFQLPSPSLPYGAFHHDALLSYLMLTNYTNLVHSDHQELRSMGIIAIV